MRYFEYHKSRTHDTINYAVLKREIEEKQLKGNAIEIAKSLRAKFVAENPKDVVGRTERRLEILTIHQKRGRTEHTEGTWSITGAMQGLTFSVRDTSPVGWNGDNLHVTQGSNWDVVVHRVYVDIGSSANIIYEHCF